MYIILSANDNAIIGNQSLCAKKRVKQNNYIGDLARMLSGSFSNQAQAFENPPLYGNIIIRIRPIQHFQIPSLFLEQAYAIAPRDPYRVRVLQPRYCDDGSLAVSNFAIASPERFFSAVEDGNKLCLLRENDLLPLAGCSYIIEKTNEGFIGNVEPGCRCRVVRKGRESYLLSQFELSPKTMRTIDRGYDPSTHEHLWGCIAGPFMFEKLCDWSDDVPSSWG